MTEIKLKDIMGVLHDAKFEIKNLRDENRILRAKVEMVEIVAGINRPMDCRPNQTVGIDLVCQLESKIKQLQNFIEEMKQPQPVSTLAVESCTIG
jgi:DNA polymerase II small subunit/DNA polymerase delta subunit B